MALTKKSKPNRCVQRLEEMPYYEQDSGGGITYQFVVKPGSLGLMSAGRVRLRGPTRKSLDTHTGWDQIYLVLNGNGAVLVKGRSYRVRRGSVVRIPRHTEHGVVLRKGERLEYVYVNAFANQRALAELIRSL